MRRKRRPLQKSWKLLSLPMIKEILRKIKEFLQKIKGILRKRNKKQLQKSWKHQTVVHYHWKEAEKELLHWNLIKVRQWGLGLWDQIRYRSLQKQRYSKQPRP